MSGSLAATTRVVLRYRNTPIATVLHTRLLLGAAYALMLFGLTTSPALAQDAKQPPAAAKPAPPSASLSVAGDQVPVSPDSTPRGAFFQYLAAARRADYATAARYLDLSNIPEPERASQGPVLARQLRVVLDRNVWFDDDTISDRPEGGREDGRPANVERIATIASDEGSVAITLRRVAGEGGGRVWKFSSSVVERIPSLYDEFGYGWLGDHVPDRLRRMRAWNLEAWQAIMLGVLVVLAWIVSAGGAFLLERLASRLVQRTVSGIGDRAMEIVRRPIRWAVALAFLVATVPQLHLSVRATVWMNRCLASLAFVTVIIIVAALVDGFSQRAYRRLDSSGRRSGAGAVTFINRVLKVLLAAVATIGVLQALGFNVSGLLAGLGIGGIAVALAAQKTLENLLGGFTLLFDKPVEVGDFCSVGTSLGQVEEFGFRSTRLRTVDRTVIAIPNSEMATSKIENFASRKQIRFLTTVRLRYGTTARQVRAVLDGIHAALAGHPRVAPKDVRVRLAGYGTSALEIELQCYIATANIDDFYAVREELLLQLMDVVSATGTGFAIPSQTVYMAPDPLAPAVGDRLPSAGAERLTGHFPAENA